jgi:hypothetical protein
MNRFKVAVLTAAFVLVAFAAEAATHSSFMAKPAPDARGLVRQVSGDQALATKYAKHFGTTPAAVVSYFRDNLRLGQLTRPHVTSVYSIGLDGNPVRRVVTLPPGTRVFSTSWGEPVIEWQTGNPLTDKLPLPPGAVVAQEAAATPAQGIVAKTDESKPAETRVAEASKDTQQNAKDDAGSETWTAALAQPTDDVVTQILATPPAELTEAIAPVTAASADAVEATSTSDIGALVAALPPSEIPGTPAPAGSGRGIASVTNWWGPVAALGGLSVAALASGRGGGTSAPPQDLPPIINDPDPIVPIPEPASILALSAGLALLAKRYRR